MWCILYVQCCASCILNRISVCSFHLRVLAVPPPHSHAFGFISDTCGFAQVRCVLNMSVVNIVHNDLFCSYEIANVSIKIIHYMNGMLAYNLVHTFQNGFWAEESNTVQSRSLRIYRA